MKKPIAPNSAMLGDRLTAHKAGSCIVIADMDSQRSLAITHQSIEALIVFAVELGWNVKASHAKDFTCFSCGDGNTPLFCLNCAQKT